MTYRLTLRQAEIRWLRERRAQLYVELLTEAQAEQDYLVFVTSSDIAREQMREKRRCQWTLVSRGRRPGGPTVRQAQDRGRSVCLGFTRLMFFSVSDDRAAALLAALRRWPRSQ